MPDPNDTLRAPAYRVEFDARTANLDSIMSAIKEILVRGGCAQCGRIGRFELELDPRVQLQREIAGVREITEVIKTGAIIR